MVRVPVPMSCVPQRMTTLPSGSDLAVRLACRARRRPTGSPRSPCRA